MRFVYADNPDEPVDNGYIFYWVYNEFNPEEIEPDTYTGFTLASRPMLPVGVGRTDRNGLLRKSQFFKQNTFEHIKKQGQLYIKLGLEWDLYINRQRHTGQYSNYPVQHRKISQHPEAERHGFLNYTG